MKYGRQKVGALMCIPKEVLKEVRPCLLQLHILKRAD